MFPFIIWYYFDYLQNFSKLIVYSDSAETLLSQQVKLRRVVATLSNPLPAYLTIAPTYTFTKDYDFTFLLGKP